MGEVRPDEFEAVDRVAAKAGAAIQAMCDEEGVELDRVAIMLDIGGQPEGESHTALSAFGFENAFYTTAYMMETVLLFANQQGINVGAMLVPVEAVTETFGGGGGVPGPDLEI